jgi:Transcriptional regulator, effector-binding domain/component
VGRFAGLLWPIAAGFCCQGPGASRGHPLRPSAAAANVTRVNETGEPQIIERRAQPYAGITATVAPDAISEIADRVPEVFGWLAAHGIAPAGAPFFRYDVIDMERAYTMTVGVPVDAVGEGAAGIVYGTLPAGRYVDVLHIGHPQTLLAATARLLQWAADRGLVFDATPGADGEHWACRLEFYLSDPNEVPDMSAWETQLSFKLADSTTPGT